jgi:hypothetical protein
MGLLQETAFSRTQEYKHRPVGDVVRVVVGLVVGCGWRSG